MSLLAGLLAMIGLHLNGLAVKNAWNSLMVGRPKNHLLNVPS
jgi:hypothetical protein